jgi:expansin (peptidoglycan-binding protein)
MEQHYVFLKDNRVANIAVFASQDEALADAVAIEHGYDDAVWVGEVTPAMYSTYDGTTFTVPTLEYLISIGIMNPVIEEPTND